jgi:hypothetical protein
MVPSSWVFTGERGGISLGLFHKGMNTFTKTSPPNLIATVVGKISTREFGDTGTSSPLQQPKAMLISGDTCQISGLGPKTKNDILAQEGAGVSQPRVLKLW